MQRSILVLGLAVSSLALGAALWAWQQSRTAASPGAANRAATVLSEPRPLPDFQLIDAGGRAFGVGNLREQWSLLFFGFARCPDVCPNTLGLLNAVNRSLQQDGTLPPFRVVFVSVDPGHDSPEQLKSYVEYFDPSFSGVTGPESELQKLTGALYMPYAYVPVGDGGDYTVEHSGALVLVNPRAEAVAYFSPPLQLKPIVAELRSLLNG